MRTNTFIVVFGYLRLSVDEVGKTVSGSIENQANIIRKYCAQHNLFLAELFQDDGWSGGNFERPGFKKMLAALEKKKANTVVTVDLSRLGRNMRESSYYAEEYFPERGIHFFTISDGFDTAQENVFAPFQFAMNEVYLRDGSRKVKNVLKNKRESGQYCACPPYGYKKNPENVHQLIPDEMTAPVVQRIFAAAASGDSSRKIAMELNADGVIPPLKYRVLYRDNFGDEGASHASDLWNYTTVKRILKNEVYLGHTLLGKTKKASIRSERKLSVPQEDWAITRDTHLPLVSQQTFDSAMLNLGKGTRNYQKYDHVRKSIFSGIAVCGRCGHSLCSCGTVYKGEREKYWYLSCTKQRPDIADPCEGVRIRYSDLMEVVRRDLNEILAMTDEQIEQLVGGVLRETQTAEAKQNRQLQQDRANARLKTIDKVITKLYMDNAEGKLDDARLTDMVAQLQKESDGLQRLLVTLDEDETEQVTENYQRFFDRARHFTHIEKLDRETLSLFVERIEVGPKELPQGIQKTIHREQPFRQSIRIFYRFIGELGAAPMRSFPLPKQSEVGVYNKIAQ